ncbi:hypothetical protein BKA66DRAFT_183283 [Pyrenochaeta sp. MPI-SDFR-AT-0127]|nr:hypothetical protein BKA66DRAFT_183283 [Pyrenochaeta sp. MPI-SDFR-AT-0127]
MNIGRGSWLDLQRLQTKVTEQRLRLVHIQQEIERLYEEEDQLRCQNETDEATLNTKLQEGVQANLLQFCNEFEARIPRELRDMVYKYVCVSDRPIRVTGCIGDSEETALFGTSAITPQSNLINPQCVSKQISLEIQETYWSCNTFEVHYNLNTKWSTEEFTQFFHPDLRSQDGPQNEFGAAPYKSIRKLRVLVDSDDYSARILGNYTTIRGYWYYKDTNTFGQAAMTELDHRLRSLYIFKGLGKLHVEMVVRTRLLDQKPHYGFRDDDERQFANMLQSMRDSFYELKHSGVHVTVTLHNYSSSEQSTTWDLTPRLVLNAEEWHSEKHDRDPTITVSDHYILNTCPQRLRGSLSDHLWRRWRVRHLLPWFDED